MWHSRGWRGLRGTWRPNNARALWATLRSLGFTLSSGEEESISEFKARMCQEPTYFQKVWSGYCLENRLMWVGAKAESQSGSYCAD